MAVPTIPFNFKAEELVASGRVSSTDLEELRNLIRDEKFSILTDEQLVLFIISCDGDLKLTIETIKEYYKTRQTGPLLFLNRKMDRTDYIEQLNIVRFGIIPNRLKDGTGIMVHGLQNHSHSLYNMEAAMAMLFMTLDVLTYDDPPSGLVMLFDMKGVGVLHLTRLKMGLIKTFCNYLQQGLPIKLREVHVFNTAYFIDKVMLILKPLLKKELIEKINFHSTNMDVQQFTDTVIPMNCLPQDLGGTAPSLDELHATAIVKLRELQPYFDSEEQQRLIIMRK